MKLFSNTAQLPEASQPPSAIFLMGPTAAGKTDLALALAEHLPVEIISVDSAMVYRGMNVGTGKPSAQELAAIPHHLIDIRDPQETYSAAEFRADALKCMADITARQRIPLLVGGTMLYFKALQQGLSPLPSANPEIRARLLEESRVIGWKALHDRLSEIDPPSALRIHPNDPQRLQRALEVYEITGKPMSEFFADSRDAHAKDTNAKNAHTKNTNAKSAHIKGAPAKNVNTKIDKNHYTVPDLSLHYQIHSFAMMPLTTAERALQRERIAKRFQVMLEQGLVEEVDMLYQKYRLQENGDENDNPIPLPALRAVGYRQVLGYLAGQYDYEEMILLATRATCQLAKRQLTWLRSLQSSQDIQYLSYPASNMHGSHPSVDQCTDLSSNIKQILNIY